MAYILTGWDARHCAQYRMEPLRDGIAVVAAMFVWDGQRFTTDQAACVPGEVPR